MSELQPGTAVTPSIRLVRPLDAGGMGSVWIAEHLALHTQVVVKFIAVELAASAEAVDRFSREAAAAAQVKSPHVVQVFDHGVTTGGVAFIVMELLEGRDLRKHLASNGRLTMAETAVIVGQVCKALARAHERGIVHRDIKPDNIFLCAVGEGETFVKLLDFGIAKSEAHLVGSIGTKTGAMVGTPYYMSPEQMVGAKTIDWRTDLWSLGVVAYECVVGARPFREEVFGALAIHIHSGSLPVPSAVEPSLPPAFDPWFARACARDAAARFASAKELGDALARVASGTDYEPAISEPIPSPLANTFPGEPVAAITPPSRSGPPLRGGGRGADGAMGPTLAHAPLISGRPNTNGGLGVSTLAARSFRGGVTRKLMAFVLALVAVVFGATFAMKRHGAPAPAPSGAASVYPRTATAPVDPSPPVAEASTQPAALPTPPATSAVASAIAEVPSFRSVTPRPAPSGRTAPLRPPATPSAASTATPTASQRHERDIF